MKVKFYAFTLLLAVPTLAHTADPLVVIKPGMTSHGSPTHRAGTKWEGQVRNNRGSYFVTGVSICAPFKETKERPAAECGPGYDRVGLIPFYDNENLGCDPEDVLNLKIQTAIAFGNFVQVNPPVDRNFKSCEEFERAIVLRKLRKN